MNPTPPAKPATPPPNTGSWSGHRRSFPTNTARRILTRDRDCQLQLPGCTGTATQADHIISHADATAAGWDPTDIDDISNGQGVCATCHRAKTRMEITRGRARAQRRRRQQATERHPGLR